MADGEQPVPVLLNLSAWKTEFKDIRSWMVADLKLKYGVKKSKAEEWIEERRIVPLLDGLDELMSERQETCVRALNEFLTEWSGSPLVVCSRLEEYGAYPTNLGLNGSVTLLPLSDGQIEWYLRRTGCGWLWEVVKDDSAVMDEETGLARLPLMLTVLVLASEEVRGKALDQWFSEENRAGRQRLWFEAYVKRRLKRQCVAELNLATTKGNKKPYQDEEKVRRWVGWLARRFRETDQTEIFIEKLQPAFLAKRWQISLYEFVFGAVFGLFITPFLLAVIPDIAEELKLSGLLLTWLVSGLLIGCLSAATPATYSKLPIETVEAIKIAWHPIDTLSLYYTMRFALTQGMFAGFSALLAGLLFGAQLGKLVSMALWMWLFFVMFSGVAALVKIFTNVEIAVKAQDNQGILQSSFHALFFAAICAPLGVVIPIALSYAHLDIPEAASLMISCGLVLTVAFFGGLQTVNAHFALRCTLWLSGYSPWNYSLFLRYCTERGFLQRVGGGYRFVHALLRDHFADTEPCPGDPTAPPAPQ
ncbi:MAG: hypothetical protein AAF889_06405 [Cyanobacteria bacterium P01_D01_bin.73]